MVVYNAACLAMLFAEQLPCSNIAYVQEPSYQMLWKIHVLAIIHIWYMIICVTLINSHAWPLVPHLVIEKAILCLSVILWAFWASFYQPAQLPLQAGTKLLWLWGLHGPEGVRSMLGACLAEYKGLKKPSLFRFDDFSYTWFYLLFSSSVNQTQDKWAGKPISFMTVFK